VDNSSVRVADNEREATVTVLRTHLLDGRLTLDEFSERVEIVYGAQVGSELAGVIKDLPALADPPGMTPSRPKSAGLTLGVIGHVNKRGRLRLRRLSAVASVLSAVDLDLREAEIDGSTATLMVFTLIGNVDVYVPEGVNVEVGGLTIIGHHRDWGRDTAGTADRTIKVRVFSVIGTIDVWRVPPDMRGGYGRITRRLQRRQRRLPS
jgi:hypothetical protein